ncbi:Spo0E family sporulation regulatory protein-aspartic acid phosphatase [Pontibacillus yanchengensis]|uniref:Spo0E family sporulation regulatory protein-aspartic acid phosphatase n=2 Tax=Pontibacillus yanchengensis TaxID=462910 RepID=A0ACC7VD49_9BACI|nr:aspartyl-phosphate phosphatase Spo0E family protein [Pontibacillus yanchengensis]MYL32118.1 Spo0E family sporulation regulatory protein-aspartic acid phosphatase [Pontibacillus yanchengensis]MYL52698.1 Spo0E family sporulation regulatory protein-aspartic acid phosphatase [Pontibacillus yanchengensis]
MNVNKELSNEELNQSITSLRSLMIEIGLTYGLNHEKTLEISQKLDIYIAETQKRNTLEYSA